MNLWPNVKSPSEKEVKGEIKRMTKKLIEVAEVITVVDDKKIVSYKKK